MHLVEFIQEHLLLQLTITKFYKQIKGSAYSRGTPFVEDHFRIQLKGKPIKTNAMKRVLSLIVITLIAAQAFAQGDLLVTPKRVVFEGNTQREELSLVNMGKDTATYSVSFLQKNMKEDGSFVTIDKPSEVKMSAEPYLRIFPRTITLAPGEPQVIMIQCRRKPDMAAGEYRSHLYFRSEKDYKPLGSKNLFKDTTLVSIELVAIYGISIPVIIRTGEVNVATSFTNLKLGVSQDTIPILEFTINRAGNCSTYGDLVVEYISGTNKPITVGNVRGVGVYTNIGYRNITLRLNQIKGVVFKTGNLRVRYTSADDAKYVVYTEAVFPITEQTGVVQMGANK